MRLVDRIASSSLTTGLAVAAGSVLAVAVAAGGFRLTVGGATALYFVIWWTALFAVLPFGVRSQAEAGDVVAGSEPGAPSLPRLREKAVWTTLAAGLTLVFAAWALPLAGL